MEFLGVLVALTIALVLATVLVSLSFLFGPRQGDFEKLSAYECGFDPFEDARHTFDVQFYLVAILFIIFDLEVTYLFPWAVTLGQGGMVSFGVMLVFLTILTVGFVYEWWKGALEWS
jgi:NADH:ubiquinone oxidoreductase subunit 3 (subunit A)